MAPQQTGRRLVGWLIAVIAAVGFWAVTILTTGECGSTQRIHGTAATLLMWFTFGGMLIAVPTGVAVAERHRLSWWQVTGLGLGIALAVLALGFLLAAGRSDWFDCGIGPGG